MIEPGHSVGDKTEALSAAYDVGHTRSPRRHAEAWKVAPMDPLENAIGELRQILASDVVAPEWRWNVRRRLSGVKDALTSLPARQPEAWLAARTSLSHRERSQLQARVLALSAGVLDKLEAETIVHELRRLLGDLEHHVQRVHDLVYDSVSLELGGSE